MKTNKIIAKLLLVLGLVVNACTNEIPKEDGDHFQIIDDGGFTNTQLDIIVSSFEEWCEATEYNRCPTLEFVSTLNTETESSIKAVSHKTIVRKRHEGVIGHCDWESRYRSNIILLDEVTEHYWFRLLVLHEVGHHLKVPHLHDGSIMEPINGNIKNTQISQSMLNEVQYF